jgi:hypothetical protein
MQSAEQRVDQEKRDREDGHDTWEDLAERLKRRKNTVSMEIDKVGKIPEDALWEELIDEDLERKMIQEIRSMGAVAETRRSASRKGMKKEQISDEVKNESSIQNQRKNEKHIQNQIQNQISVGTSLKVNGVDKSMGAAAGMAEEYCERGNAGINGMEFMDAEGHDGDEGEHEASRSWAWDDVKGRALDAANVKEARKEEIQYMITKGIWEEVSVQECWDRTGKAPVTVKWVDTDKGSNGQELIRSRLVARDFRVKGDKDREDLFAATPPLELLRLLISKTATRVGPKGFRKLLFIDVKKAHLNPKCEKDVYFWLPDEANPQAGKCGKLIHWLYGFRPAAQAWEELYAGKLVKSGFVRGRGSPVVFWHPARDLSVEVHGDDFTFSGVDEDLDWIEGLMKGWFEVKVRARLGPDETDDKEITILGRLVRWEMEGISYQADPKHRENILEKFGLGKDSKGLTVNGKVEEQEEEDEELAGEEATEFRASAALLNFTAQDSPDIQFPTKEVCREMSKPTRTSWARIKRLARYLL